MDKKNRWVREDMNYVKMYQLRRAAELYYIQNLTQQEISKILNISRPTVSRLLEEAKRIGVVKIDIESGTEIDNEISKILKKKLGLKDVIVVNTYEDDEDNLNKVGKVASEIFTSMIRPNMSIGISWGKSMNALIDNIEDINIEGISVHQIVGGLNGEDYDSIEIAFKLAAKFDVSPSIINAPAILEDEELASKLMKVPNIAENIEKAKNLDMYIMSIGSLEEDESSLQRLGYIHAKDKEQLIKKGACAHILSRIIDEDGNEIDDFNRRSISIPLDILRKKEISICIATTKKKANAILSAIKGKYINTIIIDKDCAEEILNILKK